MNPTQQTSSSSSSGTSALIGLANPVIAIRAPVVLDNVGEIMAPILLGNPVTNTTNTTAPIYSGNSVTNTSLSLRGDFTNGKRRSKRTDNTGNRSDPANRFQYEKRCISVGHCQRDTGMHWDGAERGLSVSVAGKGEDLVRGVELVL